MIRGDSKGEAMDSCTNGRLLTVLLGMVLGACSSTDDLPGAGAQGQDAGDAWVDAAHVPTPCCDAEPTRDVAQNADSGNVSHDAGGGCCDAAMDTGPRSDAGSDAGPRGDGGNDAGPRGDGGDPTRAPLIRNSDIVYLGAFALPSTGVSGGEFNYGGRGISPYLDPSSGKHTLFVEGSNSNNRNLVAQVEIPQTFSKSQTYADLPMANVLQAFKNIAPGATSVDPNDANGINFFGGLVYTGKFYISNAQWYGTEQSWTTNLSFGYKDSTNLAAGDFHGFFQINAGTQARAIAGHPMLIPEEWQALLGGPVLVGNCCLSLIGSISAGPSATVVDLSHLGSAPITGTTVLNYPIDATNGDHALCDRANGQCQFPDPEAHQSSVYNLTSRLGGWAFPAGGRTLLVMTTLGTGRYCYGCWTNSPGLDGTDCDPNGTPYCVDYADNQSSNKGPHAWPYRYQWLAYDVNDLVAVKNGTKRPDQPYPYGVWADTNMDWVVGAGSAILLGAGFDPTTNQFYVAVDYASRPQIHVFRINVP